MNVPQVPGGPFSRHAGAIRMLGDPVLRTPAQTVADFDASLSRLVHSMFTAMRTARGVGLAANQLGHAQAVFVFDCPDGSGRRVGHIVNPALVEISPEVEVAPEGCLSIPRAQHRSVARAQTAVVEGWDTSGNPLSIEGRGYFARCLQHEMDHLAGQVYLDRLPAAERLSEMLSIPRDPGRESGGPAHGRRASGRGPSQPS